MSLKWNRITTKSGAKLTTAGFDTRTDECSSCQRKYINDLRSKLELPFISESSFSKAGISVSKASAMIDGLELKVSRVGGRATVAPVYQDSTLSITS